MELLTDDILKVIDTRSDEEILALSVKEPELFAILVDRYEEAFSRKARQIIISDKEVCTQIVIRLLLL